MRLEAAGGAGTTIRQFAEDGRSATGAGALKKNLGLTIEATRTHEVGPNKTGAKGSTTVYRITEAG